MKTKDLIIGGLSIAVMVLLILLFLSPKTDDNAAFFDEDESKGFVRCKTLEPNINDGTIVSTVSCDSAIKAYEGWFKNSIMGYHIGLNNSNDLMRKVNLFNDSIKAFNARGTGIELPQIVGFRFYHSKTNRRSFPDMNQGPLKNKIDLVQVPTLSNGYDLFDVFDLKVPVGRDLRIKSMIDNIRNHFKISIYSKFRPCPRLCGSEEL